MPSIYESIYGCLAATRVASSMGAHTEGWSRQRIEETYGVLEELKPYHHYSNVTEWVHPAGSTEDGIERQKLMCTAIIEKGGRITADDLVGTWIRVLDPEKMMNMTEKFDRDLLAVAKAGLLPAGELGRCCKYLHLNTTIRSFHAIPIINAGDIENTIRDLCDVARVYQPPISDSFPYGIAYNAAVAHALLPDATVESVIDTALQHANPMVKKQLERDLAIAAKYNNPLDMEDELHQHYRANDAAYDPCRAHETCCKAFAIFAASKGDTRQCIVTGANFGRDTDCLAASVAGLAGALQGIDAVPPEWVAQVDEATVTHPYSNSTLTIKETADGMYEALQNEVSKMRRYVALFDGE